MGTQRVSLTTRPAAATATRADRCSVDGVRPAVLRQMEQRIAADQGHITPAGAVDPFDEEAGPRGCRPLFVSLTDHPETP